MGFILRLDSAALLSYPSPKGRAGEETLGLFLPSFTLFYLPDDRRSRFSGSGS